MAKCSILIIDDDLDDLEILREAFTKNGVESVHTVHTALQAFMYLQTIKSKEELPNLVVIDIYLPGIKGEQFLHDLKVSPIYSHIPVIILDTVQSKREIERYRQMGVLDYLVKPSSYGGYFELAKNISKRIQGDAKEL